MDKKPILSTTELAAHLGNPNWAIVDCRFTLMDPERGEQSYLEAHIPGAVYAHLNQDLSGKIIHGVTGRHPLPSVAKTVQSFTRLGIGPGVHVAAYDDQSGAMGAARLWWMLRWLGHDEAYVLDGGWQQWVKEGRPTTEGPEERPRREFTPHPHSDWVVGADEVERHRQDPAYRLLDLRSAERYRGQNEVIDPVAGHIPGAVSAPYTENLTPEGVFRPAKELRATYKKLLGKVAPENAIFYCGSGVTAAAGLLALKQAGLGDGRLYAGSWSEWITDHKRPVEK